MVKGLSTKPAQEMFRDAERLVEWVENRNKVV